MSERKISYTNRTFEEYRTAILENVKKYYPQISDDFSDASIGSWLIDMVASVADNLSFHIDRVFGETNINTAQQTNSVYTIARSNGYKLTGAKGAMTEVEISCELPLVSNSSEYNNSSSTLSMPNWYFAPIIKRGTKLAAGNKIFEILNDVDFSNEFDSYGQFNRETKPIRNTNGDIIKYKIVKKEIAVAGESRIYKQILNTDSVYPFMEILIPDKEAMNIESIIIKDGTDYTINPSFNEFAMNEEFIPSEKNSNGVDTYRFFEVDSLAEQYRWGDSITVNGNESEAQSIVTQYGYFNEEENKTIPTSIVTKGEWKPLTQKFITEFTDKGYLKVIFGSGESVGQTADIDCANDFSKYQISKMVRNNFLGKLPPSKSTLFILYRSGGGATSNVAKGSINTFAYLNADIAKNPRSAEEKKILTNVKNSIQVTNTIPSISGKDAPSVDEVRNMVKYNNGAQERCVTVNDYMDRIMKMPPKYGCPYKLNAVEENNKIKVYILGVNNNGQLVSELPNVLTSNIQSYLSKYKMVNDYVEIESGKIINLSFEADIFIDKNYTSNEVIGSVINKIKSYMDINKHQIGEDVFVGDLEKEISQTDGVLNLIDFRAYNETGNTYSTTPISQETVLADYDTESETSRTQIDLSASDYILNSDSDSIFEIKYPEVDIRVQAKIR